MSLFLRTFKKFSVWCLSIKSNIGDLPQTGVGCVFVASYGAIEGRNGKSPKLANATLHNLMMGIAFRDKACPNAVLAFSSCQHSATKPFSGASQFERTQKAAILYTEGLESDQFIDIGPITNSFTEMEALKAHLVNLQVRHDAILIITCELHSRAEYILAKMLFPESEIFIWCNSHEIEVQADHSTTDQRTWGRWLWCSWLRYIAFKVTSLSPRFLQSRLCAKLRKVQHDPAT